MSRSLRLLRADAGASEVAARGPLGDRYRYWRGASGRRYLFTAVEAGRLADFAEVVALLAHPTEDARLLAVAVSLLDGPDDPARTALATAAATPGLTVFVHLLARTVAERRAVIDDLVGDRASLAA